VQHQLDAGQEIVDEIKQSKQTVQKRQAALAVYF